MSTGPELPIVVLGCALPAARFAEVTAADEGQRVAIHTFGTQLLEALRAGGADPVMVAAAPATHYPHNRNLLFRRRLTQDATGRHVEIGYVNLPLMKHITGVASALHQGLREVATHRATLVVVHGLWSPFLITALACKVRRGTGAVVVMTDPPNFAVPFDNRFTLALKVVDAKLIEMMLGRFDAVIATTTQLAGDFTPNAPSMVLEGFAPETPAAHSAARPSRERPLVVYAGGVIWEYGVELLLDAQVHAGDAFDVAVCGKGPYVTTLLERAQGNPHIQYLGMLGSAQLRDLYRSADVLINPRPPDQWYVPYSFPSKLLDYLASGTPVVSTKLPGIPGPYWEHLIGCDADPGSMCQAVAVAARRDRAVPDARGRQLAFARSRTARARGTELVGFLRTVPASRNARQARAGAIGSAP